MTFAEGIEAWESDKPLEDYEAQGRVNDDFLDGWFSAKLSDPAYLEETSLFDVRKDHAL